MRPSLRYLVFLTLSAAVALAASDPVQDEQERNARLLEKWRADPAHYDRLKRDLRAFHELPPQKQERLRKLDRTLRDLDSETKYRLWGVLDRFNAWLDRLPAEDRQRLEGAATLKERLRIIKELRVQEFVRRLPQKVREELDQMAADQRAEKIVQLRKEERELRLAWNANGNARLASKPVRPVDLSVEQQQYLNAVLWPLLTPEERTKLSNARGNWPLYARTLLDLADTHPLLLPGPATSPYTYLGKLPDEYQKAFRGLIEKKGMTLKRPQQQGRWPDYAIEMTKLLRENGIVLEKQLGPSKPEDFSVPVRNFIEKELQPRLTKTEGEELDKVKGMWPQYPQKLLDLSRKYNLEIPMMRFPGAAELREKVRKSVAELPMVPDRTLREFAAAELTPEERAKLRLSKDDPECLERLIHEFYRRHPKALHHQREIDRRATFGVRK